MKFPQAEWQQREGMRQLLAALDAAQASTRYVGGCVRDTLLGLEVNDVDLATRLEPDEVLDRLRRARIKAVPTGIAHGTITAVLRDSPVEITTLRRDVSTDGRRATVAFTHDWEADAARRDFTINALSADPETGEVHDYFNGLADLDARQVRFIGDALTRIAEDHLRILRFFRFHARFGSGEPDPVSLDACTARANDLMALSRERIADELLKLLGLPDPQPTVALMVARHILKPVLPEIGRDSLDRLAALLIREHAAGAPPEPLRRLAALLAADPALAASVAARLRLSKRALKRLTVAAERDGREGEDVPALAYSAGAEAAIDRLLLGDDDPARIAAQVHSLDGWQRPQFALGGGDLIAMGLTPGPAVAKTLQAIEREWIGGGFSADRDELRALARRHVDTALREQP